MYVYICVCVYVCMYVYMHMYMYIYIYIIYIGTSESVSVPDVRQGRDSAVKARGKHSAWRVPKVPCVASVLLMFC